MRISDNTNLATDWGDFQDPGITQARANETLAQVATRVGVNLADLQSANPQITDPNKLTPGSEIRIPAPAADVSVAREETPAPVNATSRHVETSLEANAMRSLLSSSYPPNVSAPNSSTSGSGGIAQMPPVAMPLNEGYSEKEKQDLTDGLRKVYRAGEQLGISHNDIVSMLHTLAGNPPLTSKKMTESLRLFFMAKDLSPQDRKLVGDAFKASHGDPTQAVALTKLVANPKFVKASTQTKKEWLDKFEALTKRPELKNLGPEEKSVVIQALASDPPPSEDKISSTLDVLASAKNLSPVDQKLFVGGLNAAGGDPAYAANLKKLVEDPKFKSLKPAEKTAVLSQTKNYADADAVANFDRLLHKDWFRAESLDNKQRTLKTIGRLSTYPTGDRQIIYNTLDKLLGDKSPIKLEWKKYPDKSTFWGEMGDTVLYLNRQKIPKGNDKLPENDETNSLAIETVPHEVNHFVNHDKVASTFHYFESEYRAWYVEFKAEHNRVPTSQEAMDQRISWQLNPKSFYGKYAASALKNPQEAQKFYHFLESMTGMKVDAKNWKTVVKSDPATWPNKGQAAAPVPSGNVDNH